ncbi:hypothetical protein EJV47_23380 [Hymenobacter gummosus]|uniref:Histone H1 n=1 Tax=Hymenobacter gummosus TaxID=1776032 RepID=A0A431TWW8_9BACT|nr:hypothetical protein [Hymenobacter gummosus]RTQ46094.1 hypothetical protein EJV47_23380 [Hymenobacter gummosus]
MANNFGKLRDLVHSLEADFEKFYDKSNSAAGTRVRKGMQELKNLAQEIRTEVQNTKNSAGADKPAAPAAKAAPAKKAAAAPAAAKKAAPAKKK